MELIEKTKQWHNIAGNLDFGLCTALLAEEWKEYQKEEVGTIEEAKEACDAMFVAVGLQMCATNASEAIFADKQFARCLEVVNVCNTWDIYAKVVASNFSKFLPSDTSEEELKKEVQFIESQGRYSGVHWHKRGDYIVILSKEGKVLKHSKFVDYEKI